MTNKIKQKLENIANEVKYHYGMLKKAADSADLKIAKLGLEGSAINSALSGLLIYEAGKTGNDLIYLPAVVSSAAAVYFASWVANESNKIAKKYMKIKKLNDLIFIE